MSEHWSTLAANLEPSATVRIDIAASKLRQQGVDVTSLALGEPDFDTPQHIKDACVRALSENFTHYTPAPGIPELRQAIADKSRHDNGIDCGPGNVLVMPAKHALFSSALAFLDRGDEAILSDPSFVSYAPLIRMTGAKPVWVPVAEEDGFSIKAEAVAERVSSKTKMIFLCSPSNPTGGVDDPDEVRGIVELAKDHGFLILSDEIYEHIQYDGKRYSPASDAFERTITVNGLSKSHAMTGWRAGWAVADAPLYEALEKIQTQSITHVTSFVQKAMVAALTGPMEPVTQMAKRLADRRDFALGRLSDVPGISAPRPHGAFYLWTRFEADVSSMALAERLLMKHHVAVVPGQAFGPSGTDRIRLSFGAGRATLSEGIERLKAGLAELDAAPPAA